MAPGVKPPLSRSAASSQVHVILTVRDHGEPNLFAYRRVVIDVARTKKLSENRRATWVAGVGAQRNPGKPVRGFPSA